MHKFENKRETFAYKRVTFYEKREFLYIFFKTDGRKNSSKFTQVFLAGLKEYKLVLMKASVCIPQEMILAK